MPDRATPTEQLRRRARLRPDAVAVLEGLGPTAVAQLAAAYDRAVAAQDTELRRAIDGSLGLLPRVVRSRVLQVLTGGRA